MTEPCNHKCSFALFCPECVATLRAELAQVKANYTHLQDTSTQAGMELINDRDGLRELLAQCRGELEQEKRFVNVNADAAYSARAERDTLKGENERLVKSNLTKYQQQCGEKGRV